MEGRLWKRKLLGKTERLLEKYGKKDSYFKKMDQIPTWKSYYDRFKGLMKHGREHE